MNAFTRIFLLFSYLILSACGNGGNDNEGASTTETSEDENTTQMDSITGSAIAFTVNEPNIPGSTLNYDYGRQLRIPAGFGEGEFTFELWIKPDNSFPFGPTWDSTDGQLTNWTNEPADPQPTQDGGWWHQGNFLLDGHANAGNSRGTFSLQLYAGGRVRWHFYDSGGLWGIQATDVTRAPSIVDGYWHQITLVRRWSGATDADLELWVDGKLVAAVISWVRDNMRDYWDSWSGFRVDNEGWFWGVEKLTAVGVFDQYEDYKGLIDEVRYWSRAKSEDEIRNNYRAAVTGNEAGLVGLYQFSTGTGSLTCNAINDDDCIEFINMKTGYWSDENAPVQ